MTGCIRAAGFDFDAFAASGMPECSQPFSICFPFKNQKDASQLLKEGSIGVFVMKVCSTAIPFPSVIRQSVALRYYEILQ